MTMEVIARVEKYLQHGEHYARLNDDLATLVARSRLAYTDPLTGVGNRAALNAEWPDLRLCAPVVVILDINLFKQVNDRYGHAAGDLILIEVADRLCTCGGRVFRLGGDEFAIILPCSLVHAMTTMRDLCVYVAMPIVSDGTEIIVTMSVGVHRAVTASLALALARADAAMYRAKANSIGVAAYNPQVDGSPIPAVVQRPALRLRDSRPTTA